MLARAAHLPGQGVEAGYRKIMGNNPAVPGTTSSKGARCTRAAQVRAPFAYVNAEGVYREAQLLAGGGGDCGPHFPQISAFFLHISWAGPLV